MLMLLNHYMSCYTNLRASVEYSLYILYYILRIYIKGRETRTQAKTHQRNVYASSPERNKTYADKQANNPQKRKARIA